MIGRRAGSRLASSEAMSKFIDKSSFATARTRSGRSYGGFRIATSTHVLDIPAELVALVRAVHRNDFDITEVSATIQTGGSVSPLVLKILADHTARTDIPIRYSLRTAKSALVFETDDARTAIPFYQSPGKTLEMLAKRTYVDAKIPADSYEESAIEKKMYECAMVGIGRNFPTRDRASCYGAAGRTTSGDIYFGGQYSAFDERLGVHAEMAVLINALLDGATGFTHVGIASSKFPDSIAPPCGACRQFLFEAAAATGSVLTMHLFASQGIARATYSLDELLPIPWSNKK